MLDVDGHAIPINVEYLRELSDARAWRRDLETAHPGDMWLRYPFGGAIFFESDEIVALAEPLVAEALFIIEQWRPKLAGEIRRASRTIVFVRDLTAHPEKIVSFSDNSVPGALFVSVSQGDRLIDPYDLADSIIHEHRHQKLYLLERFAPMMRSSSDLVISPWREDLRPPSGLLHALFVFVELRRFWLHVREEGPERLRQRAIDQIEDTDRNLDRAFATLATCPLSETGRDLALCLDRARRDALTEAA
ncbi:MAG: aKG-HExxH-type peptide beta-hydroxylase [Terricaulis sp.]